MSIDLPRPPEWMEEALCAQIGDPDQFYPSKGGRSREAIAVCRLCPVQAECLEFALEANDLFGIWGGVSDRGRRRLRRSTLTGDAA